MSCGTGLLLMSFNLFRVVLGHLAKVAVPAVALKPGKYPNNFVQRDESHKHFWKFLDDHRVELNTEEKSAVDAYRDSSVLINNHLRGINKKIIDEKSMEEQISKLDQAIGKSTMKYPVVVLRGLGLHKDEPITQKIEQMGALLYDPHSPQRRILKRQLTRAELDSLVGFKFKEPAFASASLVTDYFTGAGIRLRILLDRGQNALLMNSAYGFDSKRLQFDEGHAHSYSDEHEALLPRDTVFKVESARCDVLGSNRNYERYQIRLTVSVVD